MRPINIKGFEDYLINKEGVVFSTKRSAVLKTDLTNVGYKRVTLCNEGQTLRMSVHKLVALTYLDGYKEGLVVNHKDGNKLNNHVSNLEWVTHSQNRKHAHKFKLVPRPHSYQSDEDVHYICKLISEGFKRGTHPFLAQLKKHVYSDIHSRRYYRDISDFYLW